VASEIAAALREAVARRADRRCEYCLIHESDAGYSHQIDHVVSRKHGGSSEAGNLAYSCFLCNRFKGADVASVDLATGIIVRLFNPRQDRWGDHFRLEGEVIKPLSDVAAVTIRLLRMNAPERIAERDLLQRLGTYPRR